MKDYLFFKVYRNCFLNSLIFKHIRLYQKNRVVQFHSLNVLHEYTEIEYVQKLIYKDSKPLIWVYNKSDYALKSIQLFKTHQIENVPYGIEEIIYPFGKSNKSGNIVLSKLPSSVTSIYNYSIIGSFNYSNYIPSNIKSISISSLSKYNQKLSKGIIPNSIEQLDLGDTFLNSGVPLNRGDLPEFGNLKHLTLGHCYGDIKYGAIPSSTSFLYLKNESMSLDHVNIKYTTITKDTFKDNINLTKLKIKSRNTSLQHYSLPINITHLKIDKYQLKETTITKELFGNCKSLHTIILSFDTTTPNINISNDTFHSIGLKHFEFNSLYEFHDRIGIFPESLTYLKLFDANFSQFKIGVLPNGLKHFIVDCNQSLQGNHFKRSLETCSPLKNGVLPTGLIEISFGRTFNLPLIKGSLPDSLLTLKLSKEYNQKITILPPNLTSLRFVNCYSHSIDYNLLPISLKSIHIQHGLINPNKLIHCDENTIYKEELEQLQIISE